MRELPAGEHRPSGSAPGARKPRGHAMPSMAALWELSLAGGRELVRDRGTLFFAFIYPFVLLALFLVAGAALPRPRSGPGLTEIGLPMALYMALASLAFFGTAVPAVAMRERGTLWLLATAPVTRLVVLLAQLPARLVVAGAQVIVVVAVAWALGHSSPAVLPGLLCTSLLGLVMLGSLGYLAAGLLRSAEMAATVLAVLLVVLVLTSGFVAPQDLLPEWLRSAFATLPTAHLGEALRHQLLGVPAARPLWVSYLGMAGGTIVFAVLALRTFRRKERR